MVELKERLRKLRDRQGKNQIQVAAELGMKQGTYSSYENGVTPKTEVLAKIASYYNVTMDYLLGISSERRPAGGELSEAFSTLAVYAKDATISADDIVALLKAATIYYKTGAPCGDIPIKALDGFIKGLRSALVATTTDDLPGMIGSAHAAATAALEVTKMPGVFTGKKTLTL